MDIRFTLPQNAKLFIKIGAIVKFGDPFYSLSRDEGTLVKITSALDIGGEDLFKHLTKIIGDPIVKGDVIAVKKGLLRTKKVHAQVSGTLVKIDHTTGDISIATPETTFNSSDAFQKAFFSGKISEFNKNTNTVTITISDSQELPLKEATENGGGEMYFFSDESHYFTATEDQILDKIVVVSDLKPHIVAKCEALGCAGFIFLKGRSDIVVNGAQIVKIADFESLANHKKKYILYSTLDKKALIYN